jgi:hypothetical protein
MQAKALLAATKHTIVKFVHEEILLRFEIPREIMSDGGTDFTS